MLIFTHIDSVLQVGQLERRISEAAKLGFKRCIVPRSAKGIVKGIIAIPCADLREVLERALGWPE
jgi:DNA repair protein RadA/Sms